jgi:glycine/D-amino acid oxidase-like deaminating enzyme
MLRISRPLGQLVRPWSGRKLAAIPAPTGYLTRGLSSSTADPYASVPSQARVVVVGGGIIGNSVAYHLGKRGFKDVVLLEQSQLTSGTTWHAAGLMVTFGSLSETSTEMRKYTKKLYSTLEAETGQSTGFKPCGFIELAAEPDRLEEYRRVAAFNRKCGVDVHEITPDEVKKLFPLCKTDDILAGFYVKDDGRVNPYDATMALAKGARMQGVNIIEGVRVAGVTQEWLKDNVNKKVTGVVLSNGQTIKADYVVNCGGMWARQFGEACGVNVPNQAAEHYYLITDPIPEVDVNWPVVEDPSSYTYIRPEVRI